ncbi:MAG: CHAT domain-containing protein [Thermodesulfobacteriota bacterium]
MKSFIGYRIICIAAALLLISAPAWALEDFTAANAASAPTTAPVQVTAETEPVASMAVSENGKTVVYITDDQGASTLWLGSADPAAMQLPETLAPAASAMRSAAISADGRKIAYTDTRADAKGDIYLIHRDAADPSPTRLTRGATADDRPAFSPDGKHLYFQQAENNDRPRIVRLELSDPEAPAEAVDTGGEAMSPAVSPDGQTLAFVSGRKDADGDIFTCNMETGQIQQITRGPGIDRFPEWDPDGKTLYFSRISADTNADGQISGTDNAVLCRTNAKKPASAVWPVTALNHAAARPQVTRNRIYYLSDRADVANCWVLPKSGRIAPKTNAVAQLETAKALSRQVPETPFLTLLAYYRVMEAFAGQSAIAAEAGLAAGKTAERIDLSRPALQAYHHVEKTYGNVAPQGAAARIRRIRMENRHKIRQATTADRRETLLASTIERIEKTADMENPYVEAEAALAKLRIIIDADAVSARIGEVASWTDPIVNAADTAADHKAAALFFRAEAYGLAGLSARARDTYYRLIRQFPQMRPWAEDAVDRLIDAAIADIPEDAINQRIKTLQRLSARHQDSLPVLAMAAGNRIGDLYYAADQWEAAKSSYRTVIDATKSATPRGAAARLSLAEILYRQERFRQAIDLYEQELNHRTAEDRIYQLAKNGYIRKTVSAGNFHYRLGEIGAARSTFSELLDYDDTIVPAHRGYIRCAAAAGDIGQTLASYRQKLENEPDNPLWRYTTGLCLTYRETEAALETARDHIETAVGVKGHVSYFHQTLGYVYEVLETVHGESGQLPRALSAYKKAYFLTDPDQHPENAANLELNLGNAYYLMGQYGKAFAFYSRRLERKTAFADPKTEILFYKRLGECAFQAADTPEAVSAYETAIENLDRRLSPAAAAKAFDRLHRTVRDRVLAPAKQQAALEKRADVLAGRQAKIERRVSAVAETVAAPPGKDWQRYKKEIQRLLKKQKDINQAIAALARDVNAACAKGKCRARVEQPETQLRVMTGAIGAALDLPEQLVALKTEMSDRLGLACQQAELWERAINAFQQAYILNKDTGRTGNLAGNRRAIAYNTYHLAATHAGPKRRRLLHTAAAEFEEVLDLIDAHGISKPEKKQQSDALLDFSFQTAMSADSATEAAQGFSEDQEKRLARTFIARIHLELGELESARTDMEKQLKPYPMGKTVSESDRYGVALLYHRAGLLARAGGELDTAFDRFAYSAELTLAMETPISAATNLGNMAAVLEAGLQQETFSAQEITSSLKRLMRLDEKTVDLLASSTVTRNSMQLAAYHNRMGVCYSTAAEALDGAGVKGAVYAMNGLTKAVGHLTNGLAVFKNTETEPDRNGLATKARLHLNKAAVSQKLGEFPVAETHFEKALSVAEAGLLPELAWRAAAGLGRHEKALAALETVPLSRAGSGPMEIIETFGPLVWQTFRQKNAETAFDLAEHIAELGRFNRTAALIRPDGQAEKRFYEKHFPRLNRIRSYEKEIAEAEAEKKPYIKKRLLREKDLLEQQAGDLPDAVGRIDDPHRRRLVMTIFGAMGRAETAADQLVAEKRKKQPDAEKTARLQDRYDDLRRTCRAASRMLAGSGGDISTDWTAFFKPQAAGLMDVMDALETDGRLIRVVPTGKSRPAHLVFTVTSSGIAAETADNPAEIQAVIDDAKGEQAPYIAWPDPASFRKNAECPHVASGTHLYRSFANRKPFKHRLLAVSNRPAETLFAGTSLSDPYERLPWQAADTTSKAAAYGMDAADTLVLPHRLIRATDVPTTGGQTARHFYAARTGNGDRIGLQQLLSQTSNLSLAILADAPMAHVEQIAHLFCLYGCPAVLVCQAPAGQKNRQIGDILTGYADMSAADAVGQAGGRTGPLLLGYRGMNPAEAKRFAESKFIQYVQAGRSDFDTGRPETALVHFENAIAIAAQRDQFSQYLPALYRFGRESAYQAGHLEKALFLARHLADRLEASQPDSKAHAEAMLTLGLIHARLKQYDQAVSVIETAVAIFDMAAADQRLADAMTDLGVVLENATSYEKALSRFRAAAELTRTLGRREMTAAQHINIGRIYDLRLNRYPEAIRHYEKAEAIYTELGQRPKTAEARLNIGRCYRLLGVFPKAEAAYEKALADISGDTADHERLKAKIIIEQANNAWFQGDFEEAFRQARTCRQTAEAGGFALLQVMARNTSGLIWWSLGNYEKAFAELEAALELAKNLNVRPDEIASTLNNLGLVHRETGNYQKALSLFDRAMAIDKRLGSKWAMAYDARNKGLTYLEMDQPEKAVPLFDEAIALSDAIGNRINAAKAHLGRANALLAIKSYAPAQAAYDKALSLSRQMHIKETRWRALYGMGQAVLEDKTDRDRAAAYFREAIDIIESMRAAIGIKDLKENFMVNRLSVYEALVQLLADMDRPAAAFEIAEQSRSRNFIDLLGTQRIAPGSAAETELYQKQAVLRSEIEATEQMLANAETPAETEEYKAAFQQLKNERENLMLDIQANHPQLSTLISVPPVDLEKIAWRLEPGVALLSYYVLENEVICWVVRHQKQNSDTAPVRMVRIAADKAQLAQNIRQYRKIIQNLQPWQRHAGELYERLMAPVKTHLDGIHTIGIIPHGALHYLSFGTLYGNQRFVVDDYSLFYLPSASVLDATIPRRIKRPKFQLKVLAIGNPDLENPALSLPFAEQEVRSIQWNFPEITLLTREKATEAWVVDHIADYDIIHIASHGEFDPVNPLMSAIKLSAGQNPADDGDLRATEVFGLDIRADMVYLSACQTGLGKVKTGDEIIGLNRSFFYAGTHTVVSSLWRVSDVSTAMLIKAFYREYTRHNKSRSLQAATRHVKNRYPHPGYWGAFTLVGDFK